MPCSCSVPGCRSNYENKGPNITVFSFPKDSKLKQKWLQAINRPNFVPGKCASVCILHFDERFILRNHKVSLFLIKCVNPCAEVI